MRKHALTVALLGLMLAACDDDARKFAAETRKILDERSAQIAARIAAESAAYKKQSAHAAEDDRALTDSMLRNDRNERTSELAADYDEGRKPVSLWRKHLAEYARIDFERNRERLVSETGASSRAMRTFEDLRVEKEKVDALAKLLDALANRRTLKEDVDAVTQFAKDTTIRFDRQICSQLAPQLATNAAAADTYGAMDCAAILANK